MKNHTWQKLTLATASLALGFIVTDYQPTQATTLNFEGTVDSGALVGEEYSGFFSFPENLVTGTGQEFFPEFIPVSSLEMNFLDTIFTQDDDFPEVAFIGNEFVGLSFNVFNDTAGNIDISFSFVPGFTDVSEAQMTYDSPSFPTGQGEGSGSVTFTPQASPNTVPEPSTLFGTMLVFGSILIYRNHHQI